jgi:signal transduction histidine kinase
METMKPLGHEIIAQVHTNALRLKQLVSQVMDIRKIDQGNMDVNYAYADFIRFASGIGNRFKGLAAKKNWVLNLLPRTSIFSPVSMLIKWKKF